LANRKTVFLHCPELEQLAYPKDCPFNTSRAGKLRKIIGSMGLLSGPNIKQVAPEMPDRLTLKKFHTAKYIKILKDADSGKIDVDALYAGLGTGDCPIFKGMYDYSALACGASLKGIELILSNQAELAFNPSGGLHHAQPDRAAGFCYLNDVALACMVLAQNNKRVLYLDIDVHHGDGVQGAFYDRNDVLTISFHQNGRTLFPGTGFVDELGTGQGKGYSVNFPLPVGTYDDAYHKAFNEIVPPLVDKFNPDVIVFELGADTLAGDPLANLYLTNNAYAKVINYLLKLNKPILMTGGGGYHIENTVRAWAYAWSIFSGQDTEHDLNIGMGGVMLESTDWQGGLKDRKLIPTEQQKDIVDPAIDETIDEIKKKIFPLHGL